MKTTVTQRDLASILATCAPIAAAKTTRPLLTCALLETTGAGLRVSAVSDTVSAQSSLACDTSKPGRVAVECRGLLDRVKRYAADAPITLEHKEGSLKLSAKGSTLRYTMHSADADGFPAVHGSTESATVAIPGPLLGALIRGTMFSVSPDETRSHINSALLRCDGEKARMVSTDGHRCSIAELPCDARLEVLVPLYALKDIQRLCEAETLMLGVTGPVLSVVANGVTYGSRLYDAQFPPYEQILPNHEHAATVSRATLLDALRSVSVAASTLTGGVVFSLDGDSIGLTSSAADAGEGVAEVPIAYSGPAAKFGVNGRYIADWLAASDAESVTLACGGELDPVMLGDGAGMTGVVMPMRI